MTVLLAVSAPLVLAGSGTQADTGIQKARTDIPSLKTKGEQGDPDAQCSLGMLFARGKGVAKDDREALNWYRKAAEQGHAKAQYLVGRMLLLGASGVHADSAEALKWVRKSAEQGYSYAQLELGLTYLIGDNIPKDAAEGLKWLRKAAEGGDPRAQLNLGLMLAEGDGMPTNTVQAYMWSIWLRRGAFEKQ